MLKKNTTITSDLVVLTLIAALSMAPYVFRMGFYSDDWGFLSMLLNSPDQSISGLAATQLANANLRTRPMQVVYQAVLFKAFGLRPLGYQLVNAAVLTSAVLFLYLILRETGMRRTVARAVSAVYLLMPNYSTDRFWFAAFGYTLTLALFLLGTYAALKALHGVRFVLWLGLGLLALTSAFLGMEVVLPLTVLIPLALWIQARRLYPDGVVGHLGILRTFLLWGSPLALFTAVVWYKVLTAVGARTADLPRLIELAVGSLSVNFGTYGIALPHTLAWSIRQLAPAALALPLLLAVVVFLWLSQAEPPPDSRRYWLVLQVCGGVVFCLGTAIFVVTPRIGFWSTGVANRVWIAAALGSAAALVGAIGWLTSGLVPDTRRHVFALAVAIICMSDATVVAALSHYWIVAWPNQLEVLDRMQRALPHPRPGTTLLLYGHCPYVGPAVAFQSPWDFAGARKVLYRDPTLAGDVVDDAQPGRFGVTDDGVWTRLYREVRSYRFSPDLLLFDYRSGDVRQLVDRPAVVAALALPSGCPPGVEGGGTVMLPFDTWALKASSKLSGASR